RLVAHPEVSSAGGPAGERLDRQDQAGQLVALGELRLRARIPGRAGRPLVAVVSRAACRCEECREESESGEVRAQQLPVHDGYSSCELREVVGEPSCPSGSDPATPPSLRGERASCEGTRTRRASPLPKVRPV